jgi:hypothetical protein
MPVIFGKSYEGSSGALEFQYDLLNPFDTDPKMFALRSAYGFGIGYSGFAVVSLLTGTPMPGLMVQSVYRFGAKANSARSAAMFAYANAAPIALVGSALAQREVWQSIGDDKTGSVHFASAGTMSGSMPMVSSQDTGSPDGGLGRDLRRLWNTIS